MDIMGIKWDVRRDINGCSTNNDNNDMGSSKNEYLDTLGYCKMVPPYFQTNPCGESKVYRGGISQAKTEPWFIKI
jgi:hypothetical protein